MARRGDRRALAFASAGARARFARLEHRWPASCALGVAIAVFASIGAGPPEVIRVRVPSGKVAGFFGPGTELRVLPRRELDELADRAFAASERARPAGAHRQLLRARHVADWVEGSLVGSSHFTIGDVPDELRSLVLSPWSPAIDSARSTPNRLWSQPDGRLSIIVEKNGDREVVAGWEQAAHAGSLGRSFSLEFPRIERSSLEIELPHDLVPELAGSLRTGPAPGARPGRQRWRFDGVRGRVDLHVFEAGNTRATPANAIWVKGATTVDVGERFATWQADWVVESGPGGRSRAVIELDSSLELIDVTGPSVIGFRWEPVAEPARRSVLSIRFSETAIGPMPIKIRAIGSVPLEGEWPIPAAQMLNATWEGGRTLVRLSPMRTLTACVERAGRRVAPSPEERPADARGRGVIAFESRRPGSVATMAFSSSASDIFTDVRGQIEFSDDGQPRMLVQIGWNPERGRLTTLGVDLPAPWIPTGLQIQGLDEPAEWHAIERSPAGRQIQIRPPTSLDATRPVRAILSAVLPGARANKIELPRVRPIGCRVNDEIWRIQSQRGASVTPLSASGLAWIDPAAAPELSPRPESSPPSGQHVVALRWIAENGAAVFAHEPANALEIGEIWARTVAGPSATECEWLMPADDSTNRARPVIVGCDETFDGVISWTWREDSGDTELSAAPADAKHRAELGVGPRGSAWVIERPSGRRGQIVAKLSLPSNPNADADVTLPLPRRLDTTLGRTIILVAEEPSVWTTSTARGLSELDPAEAEAAFERARVSRERRDAGEQRQRLRSAFVLRTGRHEASGSLSLRGTVPTAIAPGGWIRESHCVELSRRLDRVVRRTRLRLVPNGNRYFTFTLPARANLIRCWLNDQPIRPVIRDGVLRVDLAQNGAPPREIPLVIDHDAPAEPARENGPETSWPCAFDESRRGAGVEVIERDVRAEAESSFIRRLLGPFASRFVARDRGRNAVARAVELPRLTANSQPIGDWLAPLDADSRPLIVDRRALLDAGVRAATTADLEARSRIVAIGLPRATLVTTSSEFGAFANTATDSTVTGVIQTGRDISNRYQTRSRWVNNAGGEGSSLGPMAFGAGDPNTRAAEHGARASNGWTFLYAWRFVLGLAIATIGCAVPRRSTIARALFLLAALFGAVVLAALGISGGVGLVGGAAVAVSFWIGGSLARGPRREPIALASHSSRRRVIRAATPVVVVALSSVGFGEAWARIQGDSPAEARGIVVLLPYDDLSDLENRDGRAVLRLADYDRLVELASSKIESPPPAEIGALRAIHRLEWIDGTCWAESDFTLAKTSGGASEWSVPTEDGGDFTAVLDGKAAPLAIAANGSRASVVVAGAGAHRLRVRRRLTPRSTVEADRVVLAVPPIAAARLEVEPINAGRSTEITRPVGRTETRSDGTVSAALGPVGRVSIAWKRADSEPAIGPLIDSSLLWDIEPAGDRLRVRLIPRGSLPGNSLRLLLADDVLVRGASFAGWRDGTAVRAAERTEWRFLIDPEIGAGEPIELELFRPRGSADSAELRVPLIEPVGVQGFRGTLLVRHDPEMAGVWKLVPPREEDRAEVGDAVKAWKSLPAASARMSVAGAVRFEDARSMSVIARRDSTPRVVHTQGTLDFEPGRVVVVFEARGHELGGWARQLDVELPRELRITRVTGPGLSYWERTNDGRLRLRLENPTPLEFVVAGLPLGPLIRIEGWIPLRSDPMSVEASAGTLSVPWPRWVGCGDGGGFVTIGAARGFDIRVEPGAGLESSPATSSESSAPVRARYRITQAGSLGRVSWTLSPPGVDVLVRSLLALNVDEVEWISLLRARTVWGPCARLTFKAPADWSVGAESAASGTKSTVRTQRLANEVLWAVQFDPPFWGERQVVLRSRRPMDETAPLLYPDLVPLGKGKADTYLAIQDLSGNPFAAEGTSELQAIDPARWWAEGPRLHIGGGGGLHAYRVLYEGWKLQLSRASASPERGGAAPVGEANVRRADAQLLLGHGGSEWGALELAFGPGWASHVTIDLPAGTQPVAASVDGRAIMLLRDAKDRYRVPLPFQRARSARLIWTRDRTLAGSASRRAAALPALPASGEIPVSLRVFHAPSERLRPAEKAPISAVGWPEARVANLEASANQLRDDAARLDRSSDRDRARLEVEIAGFRSDATDALRAIAAAETGPARLEDAAALRSRVSASETMLESALQSLGLGDLAPKRGAAAFRTAAGAASRMPGLPEVGVAECFAGALSNERAITFESEPARLTPRANEWRAIALAAGVSILLPGLYWSLRRAPRSRTLAAVAATAWLAIAALVAGPSAAAVLGISVGLGAAGRQRA